MEEETIDNDLKEIRGKQRSNKVGKRIKFNLPNAQNVQILGIIAIPAMFMYWAGVAFAIMAIVRYHKDLPIYKSDPDKYAVSYKRLRTGYVLSWVAIGIGILSLLLIIAIVSANV